MKIDETEVRVLKSHVFIKGSNNMCSCLFTPAIYWIVVGHLVM